MRNPLRPSTPGLAVAGLLAMALCAGDLAAHGGQYRGPSSTTPPSGGSSGSGSTTGGSGSSGGSSGPSTAGGTGGSAAAGAGASAGPAGGAAARATPRGVQLEADPSGWESWWEFQKDPLVRLRDVLGRAAPADALLGARRANASGFEPPTASDVRERVLPALQAALHAAADRDTVTGCLVAMAKIGVDLPGRPLHDEFRRHLVSKDQEVRETAALCLGIARRAEPRDLDLLRALLLDDPIGRTACDRARVDDRTRAFAAYALGLSFEQADADAVQPLVDALTTVLAAAETQRNVAVAAIAALGQVGGSGSVAPAGARAAAIAALEQYYDRPLGPGLQLVQAHCPLALAGLLGREHADSDRFRVRFAKDLATSLAADDRSQKERTNHHIAQSCALALGDLARPWADQRSPDAAIGALLLRCYREHKDQQTRWFAALALGRIGGAVARQELLRELARANRSVEKPWTALSLAVLVHERDRRLQAAGATVEADPEVGAALLGILDDVKTPTTLGAAAIAIGLARPAAAGDRLRALLGEHETRDEVAGPVALGLALLGERRAASALRALLPRSVHRPQLLVALATALGRLGEAGAVDDLAAMLGQLDGGLARLSAIAGAVGQIGDRRCLAPLLQLLGDEHALPLTRAFAAVALGGVCDRDSVPWNARFAYSLNYRAAVETLTDGAAGILDIL